MDALESEDLTDLTHVQDGELVGKWWQMTPEITNQNGDSGETSQGNPSSSWWSLAFLLDLISGWEYEFDIGLWIL